MRKTAFLSIIIAMLVAMTGCDFLPFDLPWGNIDEVSETPEITTATDNPTQDDTIPEQSTSSEDEEEGEQSSPSSDELKWIVKPTLGLEKIFFCPMCNGFFEDFENRINEIDGSLTDVIHGGHGGGSGVWLYDAEKDLLGYYTSDAGGSDLILHPPGEFEKRFPGAVNRMMTVNGVDSTKQKQEDWGVSLPPEAFTGKVAVAYNGKFVTDFIFDGDEHGYNPKGRFVPDAESIAVIKDKKHGMVDKSGKQVLPFVFEDLSRICEDTAFAGIDGKYGIVSINGKVPPTSMTTTENLNLRQYPNTEADVLTVIPKDEKVELLSAAVGSDEETPDDVYNVLDWVWVKYEGTVGFVVREFLK